MAEFLVVFGLILSGSVTLAALAYAFAGRLTPKANWLAVIIYRTGLTAVACGVVVAIARSAATIGG